MPIDPKKVSKKMEKLREKEIRAQRTLSDMRKLWEKQSLKDSLYNDDGKGNKVPRASDIDQGSHHDFGYIAKGYVIPDCYLLSDLMGLAKNNPRFIQDKLIQTTGNDNIVNVWFFETKLDFVTKRKSDIYNTTKVIFSPSGSKKSYSVSKDEALKWKTSHSALWPVVIEIAYAKYIKEKCYDKSYTQVAGKSTAEPESPPKKKPRKSDTTDSSAPKTEDLELRKIYEIGFSSRSLTELTGATSRMKSFTFPATEIKAFEDKYSPQALKVYDEIQKKLRSNKIISIVFKNLNRRGNNDIAFGVVSLAINLKSDPNGIINALTSKGVLTEKKYTEWLTKNKLTLEKLKTASDKICEQFILENVDFEKYFKLSKSKSGLSNNHAYLVLGTIESNGYKYILLRNPHKLKTKIDYSSKIKKLPKIVKLPKEIDMEKNECMMELNHFFKYSALIEYNKTPII